ncbi:unnamed protein product [Sphagnum balticum]
MGSSAGEPMVHVADGQAEQRRPGDGGAVEVEGSGGDAGEEHAESPNRSQGGDQDDQVTTHDVVSVLCCDCKQCFDVVIRWETLRRRLWHDFTAHRNVWANARLGGNAPAWPETTPQPDPAARLRRGTRPRRQSARQALPLAQPPGRLDHGPGQPA